MPMQNIPVAQASVILTLDSTQFKPALQNALKGHEVKVNTANATRDIERFAVQTSRTLRSASRLMIEATAPAMAFGGLAIREFLKQGSVDAMKFQYASAGVKDSMARIGGELLKIKVSGKNATEWLGTFANYLNKIDPKTIERTAKVIGGIVVSAIALRTIGELVHLLEKLWKLKDLGIKIAGNINVPNLGNNLPIGNTLSNNAANAEGSAIGSAIGSIAGKREIKIDNNRFPDNLKRSDFSKWTIPNKVEKAKTDLKLNLTNLLAQLNNQNSIKDYSEEAEMESNRLREKVKIAEKKYNVLNKRIEGINNSWSPTVGNRGINNTIQTITNFTNTPIDRALFSIKDSSELNIKKIATSIVTFLGKSAAIVGSAIAGWEGGKWLRENYAPHWTKGLTLGDWTNRQANKVFEGIPFTGGKKINDILRNTGEGADTSREDLIKARKERQSEIEDTFTKSYKAHKGFYDYQVGVKKYGIGEWDKPEDRINKLIESRDIKEDELSKVGYRSSQWEKINNDIEESNKEIKQLNMQRSLSEKTYGSNTLKNLQDFEEENKLSGHEATLEEYKPYTKDIASQQGILQSLYNKSTTKLNALPIGSEAYELEKEYNDGLKELLDSLANAVHTVIERLSSKAVEKATRIKEHYESIHVAAKNYEQEQEKIGRDEERALYKEVRSDKPLSKRESQLQSALNKAQRSGNVKELMRLGKIASREELERLTEQPQGSFQSIGLTQLPSYMASMQKAPNISNIAGTLLGGKDSYNNAFENVIKLVESINKSFNDFSNKLDESIKTEKEISKDLRNTGQ